METRDRYRFDPIDHQLMRVRGRLSPAGRLHAMFAARTWIVSAIRNRLWRRYPDLPPEALNLKVLEEIEHAERRRARSRALS